MKYSKEVADSIVKILKLGGFEKNAYEFIGVDKVTYYRWMREKEDFRHMVNEAKQGAYVTAISALQTAVSKGSIDAIKFWFTNKYPALWKNKQHMEVVERKEFLIKEVKELRAQIDIKSDKDRKQIEQFIRELPI